MIPVWRINALTLRTLPDWLTGQTSVQGCADVATEMGHSGTRHAAPGTRHPGPSSLKRGATWSGAGPLRTGHTSVMNTRAIIGSTLAVLLVAGAGPAMAAKGDAPGKPAPVEGLANGNAGNSSNARGNSNGNGNSSQTPAAESNAETTANGNGSSNGNGNGSSNSNGNSSAAKESAGNSSTESAAPGKSETRGNSQSAAQSNASVEQSTDVTVKQAVTGAKANAASASVTAKVKSIAAREQVKTRALTVKKAKRTALDRCVKEQLALLSTDPTFEPTPEQLTEATEVCEAAVGDTGDYIVIFTPGSNSNAQAKKARESKVKVGKVYTDVFPGMAITATDRQILNLRRNPNVQFIEADGVVQTVGTDTTATWGLDRIDQRALPLDGSFTDNGNGAGVRAYVVDTGIRGTHNEFGGRVTSGYTAINDGNGWNDCNGHGTHVAGTIGGSEYGVSEAVTLVPVRVLGCTGSGSLSGVVAGLDWVARDHTSGPAVANMSLGSAFSTSVNSAVASLVADGVTVVVAAGNDNADACNSSPASTPSAITVGATTNADARASYSNFGTCLDLFAPGSSITSAWYTSDTVTAMLNGTSMASPHVAGAAAALLSRTPSLAPSQVASTLIADANAVVTSPGVGSPNRLLFVGTSASPTPSPSPTQPTATAPEAPTSVTASGGKRQATVRWALGADGGSPFTGQTVFVFAGGQQVGMASLAGSATSAVLKLQPGTYTFTVVSKNVIGSSAASTPSSAVTVRR